MKWDVCPNQHAGKTRTDGPRERATDLSLKTLLADLLDIIVQLFPEPKEAPALVVS